MNNYRYEEYQEPARRAIREARNAGVDKGLVVIPGGLGKTIIAAHDVKDFLDKSEAGRVLVLCHDTNVLAQSAKKFHKILGYNYSLGFFHGTEKTFRRCDVLFASFQTLEGKRKWKKQFEPDEFEYVVVDEAHHARAKTFESVISYFRPKFLLGLTATPYREDGKPLSEVFGEPIVKMEYLEALAKGYLAPVSYNLMTYEVSKMDEVVTSNEKLAWNELNEKVTTRQDDEELVADIEKRLSDFSGSRVVVFCSSIKDADTVAKLLSGSLPLHNNLPVGVQQTNLQKFRDGEVSRLVAVNKLNEGIDVPEIDVIVRLRQTGSKIIFNQQLFRGARLSDGKEKLVVFDYASSAEQIRDLLSFEQEVEQAHRSEVANNPRLPIEPPFVVTITGGEWKSSKVDILAYLENVGRHYTDQELIERLQEFAKKLGRTPTRVECNDAPGMSPASTYEGRFGSWNAALKTAGLEPKQWQRTDEELIKALQDFAKRLGRAPTYTECNNTPGMPSATAYQKRFGSWNAAIEAAGLVLMYATLKRWTNEEAISALRNLAKQLGKIPSRKDCVSTPGMPSPAVYQRCFGSWNKALEAAGFELKKQRWTDEELIKALQDFAKRLGKTPSQKDCKSAPEMPDVTVYWRRFGSWNAAIEAAGLVLRSSQTDEELIKALQDFAKRLGRTPACRECDNAPEMPSTTTYRKRFGSWNAAIEAAGLVPNEMCRKK